MKALVIGATGATGKELVYKLLRDEAYSEVHVFLRNDTFDDHVKLKKHFVNFDKMAGWRELLSGDVLFSSLGTTLKQAGSKDKQYTIDYTYQFEAARFASGNGVSRYVLVSAAGADSKSMVFYSRMKGQLEDAVKMLPFDNIHLFRPGILDRRDSERAMENISLALIRGINKLGIAKKYRPLPVEDLAEKMLKVSKKVSSRKLNTYTMDEIFGV